MNRESQLKVTAGHLARLAYLYVRQSTLRQVLEHTESTKRQYGLRERAVALGWAPEQIVIIDRDLGLSGADNDRAGPAEKQAKALPLHRRMEAPDDRLPAGCPRPCKVVGRQNHRGRAAKRADHPELVPGQNARVPQRRQRGRRGWPKKLPGCGGQRRLPELRMVLSRASSPHPAAQKSRGPRNGRECRANRSGADGTAPCSVDQVLLGVLFALPTGLALAVKLWLDLGLEASAEVLVCLLRLEERLGLHTGQKLEVLPCHWISFRLLQYTG